MLAKLSSHRQFVVPVDVEERYPADLIKGAAQALEQNLEEGKTFSSLEEMIQDLHQIHLR